MKKNSILCLLLLSALTLLVGCKADPEAINNTPEVFADEASDVLRTSAVLTGRIMAPAKASIKEYGFLVSSSSDFTSSDTQTIKCDENLKEFSAQITDLEIGGTYFYAAYATGGLDRMTSTVRAFTTPTRSGVLLTELRMVDEKTATFSARVADTGGGEINAVGLCWATDNTPTTYDKTVLTELNADNTFTASLTGLEAGKTYYVRAFADSDILGDGTTQTISYSRDVVEITLEEPINERPSISVEALSATTTSITYQITSTAVEQVRQLIILEEALEVYGEITPEFVFISDDEIEPNTTVELTASDLTPASTYYVFAAAKAGEEYLISEPAVIATQPEEVDPELTKIFYTTTDEQTITSFSNPSGLNLVSNSYENGRGVITFDGVITQIPNNFMYGKSTLKSIALPGAVTQIGYGAFESCSALESLTLPEGVAEIGQMAFAYTALRELILPESVAEIDNQAFMNCSDLERVTISGSPAVNTDAFSGCSSISSVHITSLEAWCKCDFGGWAYLMYSASNPCSYGATLYLNGAPVTEVTIPQGVTSLSDGAFAGCGSLLKVTIPDHVTEIGSRCFNACENLETVYCLSTTPATPKPEVFPGTYGDQYDWHPFSNGTGALTIYVPNASVESYRTAWLWKQYADCIYPMDPVEETWKIYYTSTDGKIVEPHDHYAFGFDYATWTYPTIVSNSYSNGKGTIVFDKEITSMGDYAFMECTNLESIIIPESVTSIGAYAFSNCSLSAILIPDAVVEIGNQAFSGCSKLASATIGQGVTSIGAGAFYRCDNLEAITIPDNVTTIDNEAFFNCDALVSATIGSGVTSIGGSVFNDCNKLESVYCYPTTPPVTSFGGATWSAWAAFDSCSTALKIYVPNASVTAYKTAEYWSDYADRIYPMDGEEEVPETWKIYYTSTDGNIVEPYDTTVFGANIVSNTYENGQGVILFDRPVTSIGDSAFSGCSGLTSVTIPDSVTSIGGFAFSGCSSLTSITIPDSVASIGNYVFSECTSLTSATIGNSVTSIGNFAFYGCSSLTSVTIPDSATSIREGVFSNCTSLTSVTIGKGVTSIGSSAFRFCESLTSVTIPDSVTSIGSMAFANCDNLTSVTIGDRVTSIGRETFYYCTSLTSVTIGKGVASIGYRAFSVCENLQNVYISDMVAWCKIEFERDTYSFNANPLELGAKLYLNGELVTNLVIPNDVTEIKDYAFYCGSSLTSVTIPDSVTSIGEQAFYKCTGLTSVTIGNGVTSIGGYAFRNCSGLTSITIPDSVTSIGYDAFEGCTGLTRVDITDLAAWCRIDFSHNESNPLYNAKNLYLNGTLVTDLVIPDGVTSIGESAFYNCNNLTTVHLGRNLTSISAHAFNYCSKLSEVYCDAVTPPAGGYSMFGNNASGRKIYVPNASVEAYKAASGWSDYAADIVGYDF